MEFECSGQSCSTSGLRRGLKTVESSSGAGHTAPRPISPVTINWGVSAGICNELSLDIFTLITEHPSVSPWRSTVGDSPTFWQRYWQSLQIFSDIDTMASAMMMSTNVVLPAASLCGSKNISSGNQHRAFGLPQLSVRRQVWFTVRAAQQQQEKDNVPLPGTKVDVTEGEEEPLRVFDNSAAGKFFRPESERRPESGNTDFQSVMKFDGPAPETINGRLAMVGITWAFAAEITTGLSVTQQTVGSTGLIWFLAVVPLFIWASFVPIFGWNESPDSRSFGPFNAKAERWNGRAAMIGFVSLLISENLLLKAPLFGFLHK